MRRQKQNDRAWLVAPQERTKLLRTARENLPGATGALLFPLCTAWGRPPRIKEEGQNDTSLLGVLVLAGDRDETASAEHQRKGALTLSLSTWFSTPFSASFCLLPSFSLFFHLPPPSPSSHVFFPVFFHFSSLLQAPRRRARRIRNGGGGRNRRP